AGGARGGGVIDERPGGFEVRGGPRELELHTLELCHRLAELPPLFRVMDGVVERSLREADHLGADADAALVQGLDGDLVPLAYVAQHAIPRHEAILEDQLTRAAGADSELVLLPSDGEARC